MKVLITDVVDESLIQGLNAAGYCCDYRKDIKPEEISNIIAEYTGIIITTKIALPRNLLSEASQLKFIARLGSGLDHVDVEYAREKGMAIYTSPEANAGSVGEHAVGMLISMMHNFKKSYEDVCLGNFRSEPYRVHELRGMTIGIMGYGHTGPAFARRLRGFDVQVIGYDKYRENFDMFCTKVDLHTLQAQAEVLSIHLPLTDETRYMIDKSFLKACKKLRYLINTSRGHILDLQAMLELLDEKHLQAAALDVLDNENINSFNETEKKLFERLVQHPDVFITPHIAGKSHSTRFQHAQVILSKILRKQ